MKVVNTLLAGLGIALAAAGCNRGAGQKPVAYSVTEQDREVVRQNAGFEFTVPQYPVTDEDRELAMKHPGGYFAEGLISSESGSLGEGAFEFPIRKQPVIDKDRESARPGFKFLGPQYPFNVLLK